MIKDEQSMQCVWGNVLHDGIALRICILRCKAKLRCSSNKQYRNQVNIERTEFRAHVGG